MPLILRLNFIVILLVVFVQINGQGTFIRYQGEKEIQVSFGRISYLGAGDSISDPASANRLYESGKFVENKNRFLNLGIAKDNYWLAIQIINTRAGNAELMLNLENPRLNKVEVYQYQQRQLISAFTVGDKLAFGNRAVIVNHFAVPVLINPGDTLRILLFVSHKDNTLQLPITIQSLNGFLSTVELNYLVMGITVGILVLSAFFSIFLYLKSFNRLFVWYALYVLSTTMWLISTEGFGFQFLWSAKTDWAQRFGPGFSVFNLCTFVAVALEYTKSYDNTRRIRNFLRGIVVFTIFWGLQAFMPYINPSQSGLMSFYLTASFMMYGVVILSITSYLLYVSLRGHRLVLYYFFTGITSIVFSILLIAQNSGGLNLPLSSGTFISIGLVFEVILMTLGITTQFYKYKKEKEALLISYNEQQKNITIQLQNHQEKERKRISREMHDDIGAGLTQVTLMSESAKTNNNPEVLNAIGETCRKLVDTIGEIIWSLNPEHKTLSHLCSYLREQLNSQLEYSQINYSIVLPEGEADISLTNEQRRNILLIIRELVNNAIKYSSATNISIQMNVNDNWLRFSVIDNGTGFDVNKTKKGNGIKNIKSRVAELSGTLTFFSEINKGTDFKIIIPLSTT